MHGRKAIEKRKTKETSIFVLLDLDKKNETSVIRIEGIPFLQHMLDLFAMHCGFYLEINAKGDIEVDFHHTVEDLGICLGKAFKSALGDKKGIKRYASLMMPMDDVLVSVAVDISGRPYFDYNLSYYGRNGLKNSVKGMIGNFDIYLIEHFFKSFVDHSFVTLHVDLVKRGSGNLHHIMEAVFKGVAKVLGEAVILVNNKIPSSKGLIE